MLNGVPMVYQNPRIWPPKHWKEKFKIKIDNSFWVLHLFHMWDVLMLRVGEWGLVSTPSNIKRSSQRGLTLPYMYKNQLSSFFFLPKMAIRRPLPSCEWELQGIFITPLKQWPTSTLVSMEKYHIFLGKELL